jgi:hypothetical protein
MDTEPPHDQVIQREVERRLDNAVREQFPVIVDFDRRLEILERKIVRIRDLTTLTIGVGLGIALGELVENWGSAMSWGWPAAVTCGFTILGVIFVVRPYLK